MTHHGSVTVASAGTAVNLGTGTPITSKSAAWVLIQAKTTNTGRVFIGDSRVSSSSFGVELSSLDSLSMPPCEVPNVYDLGSIFIDSENDDDGVTFMFEVV